LVAAGLPHPVTQIEVRDSFGARFARLNMGWEDWLVGVEFDGAQHWTDAVQRTRDIDRLAELESFGWTIVRVSADLLRKRPDVVVERTRCALRNAGCPI
jgi:very-short-patch-repair endonuclease